MHFPRGKKKPQEIGVPIQTFMLKEEFPNNEI